MIEVQDISYSYDRSIDAVKDVSFSLNDGDFLSIIGPNGSGKTTLLKAIAYILEHNGNIVINQENLKELTRKEKAKKISYFSQIKGNISELSVHDTVMLGRYPYLTGLFSTPSKNDEEVVLNAIRNLGLFDIKDKLVSQLSGGQLQRVFLAQILVQDTKIILLDEPTNHLDLKYQIETLEFIKEYAKKSNKIVISVLHDLNLARRYANKVLLLNNGKMNLFGSNKEIFDSNNINSIYEVHVKNFMINSLKEWI